MEKKRWNPAEGKTEEQETRQKILAAARQLMSQKGFKGATTRLIAEAAGVNEVTIFRHFGNKEGLIHAMLEGATAIRPQLEQLQPINYDNVRDFLIDYGKVFYQSLLERKEILLISMIEAQSFSEDCESSCILNRIPKVAVLLLIEKLEEFYQQGKIAKIDFCVLAHMFISSFFSAFIMRYQVGNGHFEIDEETLILSSAEILSKTLQK